MAGTAAARSGRIRGQKMGLRQEESSTGGDNGQWGGNWGIHRGNREIPNLTHTQDGQWCRKNSNRDGGKSV